MGRIALCGALGLFGVVSNCARSVHDTDELPPLIDEDASAEGSAGEAGHGVGGTGGTEGDATSEGGGMAGAGASSGGEGGTGASGGSGGATGGTGGATGGTGGATGGTGGATGGSGGTTSSCPSPGEQCGGKECCNLKCTIWGLPLGNFEGCCADETFGVCGVIEDTDGGPSCTLVNVFLKATPGIDCKPK
ncbi:MAG TPA: hypothetical protein PKL73_08005 [Polyangiaceae bacterium]|nr:hypothetical protein [Polyangiaceae bacterium]HOR36673.1 hypothetical protein [Polyangiaceae bacterium]